MIVNDTRGSCISCIRIQQRKYLCWWCTGRTWWKMMIAAFSKSLANKLKRSSSSTCHHLSTSSSTYLMCSSGGGAGGPNTSSDNSSSSSTRRLNNMMGVKNKLCSWFNQCIILGLLLPLAFLIIVADKDSLHEGSVRALNSGVGLVSGGGGSSALAGGGNSKSKPARFNTLQEESQSDKNQHRPTFDNTTTNNVTIQEGRTAYLICRIKQLGDRTVSWIRRKDYHILTSGHFTYTTDQRFQSLPLENTGDWTLQIKYAQKRDAGEYECQVTWEKGVISWFVTLNVVVPKATINAGFSDYYIKSGSTITLNCIITDSPDNSFVFWYHNERMINYDTVRGGIQVKTEAGTVTTSSLYVADAQHADSGNYTCRSEDATPTSIIVHVLNGDKSAAMQHEGQKSGGISVLLQRPLDALMLSVVMTMWMLSNTLLNRSTQSDFILR